MTSNQVYAQFFGDSSFPVEWANEAEKQEFWWYDDLHLPRPVSPLYYDIGRWWVTCEYMFQRFWVPFGTEWKAKLINGYLYTAVMRRTPEEAAKVAPYFGMMLPVYASRFGEWWEKRYLPEVQRNLAFLDDFPYAQASLQEMLVLMEDAMDIQERHLRIHWILNMAQFASFLHFGNVVGEVAPAAAAQVGKVLVSVQDRNWDSTRDLWQIKEDIKGNPEIVGIFNAHDSVPAIVAALKQSVAGRDLLARIDRYKDEYGQKSIYAHEYIYPLWKENPTPIWEMLRGYVATDYDFNKDIQHVVAERDGAIAEIRKQVKEADRDKFEGALNLAVAMAPLTPDHHFYLDQGTHARMRTVLLNLGRKFVARGDFADPEDIFYLLSAEIRQLAAQPDALDARARIAGRRAERDKAFRIVPRDWVGTADHWSLYEQAYAGIWGYPERFHLSQAKAREPVGEIRGLAASPGVVEGTARVVDSPEDFDQVQKGDILVCRMTSPAWTLVFTKISGLVTDSGGVLSHPAVVSREFGIPAVTSTLDATGRIKSGQRVRVNGSEGLVQVLG